MSFHPRSSTKVTSSEHSCGCSGTSPWWTFIELQREQKMIQNITWAAPGWDFIHKVPSPQWNIHCQTTWVFRKSSLTTPLPCSPLPPYLHSFVPSACSDGTFERSQRFHLLRMLLFFHLRDLARKTLQTMASAMDLDVGFDDDETVKAWLSVFSMWIATWQHVPVSVTTPWHISCELPLVV